MPWGRGASSSSRLTRWPCRASCSGSSTVAKKPSFDEALRGLREHFVRGSENRLDRIERVLDLLDRDPGDARVLRDLMIQFHGFSGAGSTYGFPGVSALGAEGERLCDALMKA